MSAQMQVFAMASKQVYAPPLANILGAALVDAVPQEEQAEFKRMMAVHDDYSKLGKVVYHLTKGSIKRMEAGGRMIEHVAQKLMLRLNKTFYVHYNIINGLFRLGEIIDDHDYREIGNLTFLYVADINNPDPELSQTSLGHIATTLPLPLSLQVGDSQTLSQAALSGGEFASSAAHFPTTGPINQKIPKPANSWILYRASKHKMVKTENPGMKTADMSIIIGAMWKNESQQVKNIFQKLAEEEKRLHALRFPGYKVRPRRSSAIRRRRARRNITTVTVTGDLNGPDFLAASTEGAPQPLELSNILQGSDAGDLIPLDSSAEDIERLAREFSNNVSRQYDSIVESLFSFN